MFPTSVQAQMKLFLGLHTVCQTPGASETVKSKIFLLRANSPVKKQAQDIRPPRTWAKKSWASIGDDW